MIRHILTVSAVVLVGVALSQRSAAQSNVPRSIPAPPLSGVTEPKAAPATASPSSKPRSAILPNPRVVSRLRQQVPVGGALIRGVAEEVHEQILVQALLIEMRGDVPRAFERARLQDLLESGRATMTVPEAPDQEAPDPEHKPDPQSAALRTLADFARVDVLSRPQVRTLFDQMANIQVGVALLPYSGSLTYLVRTGETTFEMRTSNSASSFGINVELTPRRVPGRPELIEIAPLKISTTTMDGREPIPGIDLDVGKPIIATRSLETSLTMANNEPHVVLLPGPPGRQSLMFLSARLITERFPVAQPAPGGGDESPAPRPRSEDGR